MSSKNDAPPAEFTTNEEDQREVAGLQARLRERTKNSNSVVGQRLPSVQIDDGAHKYVLIKAEFNNGDEQYFVTSRRGAPYHRNAAEPMIQRLEANGYNNIQVTGGGRIFLNEENKKISIFGYSYGFGLADHSISRDVVKQDARYRDYDISISNDGY